MLPVFALLKTSMFKILSGIPAVRTKIPSGIPMSSIGHFLFAWKFRIFSGKLRNILEINKSVPNFAYERSPCLQFCLEFQEVMTKIPSGIPMSSVGRFLFAWKSRNFYGKLGNFLEINKSVPNFAYERSPCLQFCLEFQEVMTKILPGILEFSIEG